MRIPVSTAARCPSGTETETRNTVPGADGAAAVPGGTARSGGAEGPERLPPRPRPQPQLPRAGLCQRRAAPRGRAWFRAGEQAAPLASFRHAKPRLTGCPRNAAGFVEDALRSRRQATKGITEHCGVRVRGEEPTQLGSLFNRQPRSGGEKVVPAAFFKTTSQTLCLLWGRVLTSALG